MEVERGSEGILRSLLRAAFARALLQAGRAGVVQAEAG